MTDLIEFIKARLDEAEQLARNCTEREWRPDGANSCAVYVRRADYSTRTIARCANGYDDDFDNSRHIARHDPARVLRKVEADRLILDALDLTPCPCSRAQRCVIHDSSAGPPESAVERYADPLTEAVLRALALPHDEHPDYRDEWRPA